MTRRKKETEIFDAKAQRRKDAKKYKNLNLELMNSEKDIIINCFNILFMSS